MTQVSSSLYRSCSPVKGQPEHQFRNINTIGLWTQGISFDGSLQKCLALIQNVFFFLKQTQIPKQLNCFCRRGIALASLGGPIYAIGGLDDNTCFSDVERYDIESDQWSTVAPMNTPRGGVGSVALIVSYTAPSRNEAPGTALVSTVWLRSALQHWLVLNCL